MTESRWAARFLAAGIVQGGVAFVVMGVLLYLAVFGVPAASRIVAAGGAGNWMIVGLIGFALVGVIGVAMSALFYHHLEVTLRRPYEGWRNYAAWAHLILGGGGSSAAALLAAYGGYQAGAALLPATAPIFGGGKDALYVHVNILGPLALPIAALAGIGLLGFFVGGVGYVTAWWSAMRAKK